LVNLEISGFLGYTCKVETNLRQSLPLSAIKTPTLWLWISPGLTSPHFDHVDVAVNLSTWDDERDNLQLINMLQGLDNAQFVRLYRS
jgi:hypothetical protein